MAGVEERLYNSQTLPRWSGPNLAMAPQQLTAATGIRDMTLTKEKHSPLIVHVIDRLVIGGMENGLVNLINHTTSERYQHAIICLRSYSEFRKRISRDDVRIYALNKRPGNHLGPYVQIWHLLRQLRPAIVHTRNLPTIDIVPVVAAAGVPWRVHGEHGRDLLEVRGDNRKYNFLRRAVSPLVHRYITVSRDIESWLCNGIGIPAHKIRQIYNGVDVGKFFGALGGRQDLPAGATAPKNALVIGTVGRMEPVKDQLTLVRAFIRLCHSVPKHSRPLYLVLIGDGSLRESANALLSEAGLQDKAWLPGSREDVPDLLRAMDVFVLPSVNEGISNTIIEAMASGVPVVATQVGGNPELVVDGVTGTLVPAQDPEAMAQALRAYVVSAELRATQGKAGRSRVSTTFSLDSMIAGYLAIYDELLDN